MHPKDVPGVRFPDVSFASSLITAAQTSPPLQRFIPHVRRTTASSHSSILTRDNEPHVKLEDGRSEPVVNNKTDHTYNATLLKAVSFYENTSRFVIRAIEEFEVDGHEEPDTRFHCEFFPTPGAEITSAFAFTIHTYSESGTFGIEHRLKYTPDPNHILQGKLGKFQDESDFLAHTAPLFFADLAQQIDLALGRS